VAEFERWPQMGSNPKLSVLRRFKLALAWFDEGWGLRQDEEPPPPSAAALDPMCKNI